MTSASQRAGEAGRGGEGRMLSDALDVSKKRVENFFFDICKRVGSGGGLMRLAQGGGRGPAARWASNYLFNTCQCLWVERGGGNWERHFSPDTCPRLVSRPSSPRLSGTCLSTIWWPTPSTGDGPYSIHPHKSTQYSTLLLLHSLPHSVSNIRHLLAGTCLSTIRWSTPSALQGP